MKREERAERQRKFAQARRDSIDSVIGTLKKIDLIEADAKDNGGFGETGRSGAFMRNLPLGLDAGTAAYDLKAQLGKIDANSAFGALQRMRDNSPTGGALGAITERELELLKSSVAALDPNQSQETFVSALDEARQVYLQNLERLHPKAAEAYRRIRGRQTGGGKRTSPAPAQRNMNNARPSDIDAIMQKYGAR